jgi:dihydroorotase
MLGLETALPIINMTMVQTGLLTWSQVADRMSAAPARIGRYEKHGSSLTVGSRAHITVMNPTQLWRVDRDRLASRSRNTPFHGMEIPGVVQATFFNGRITHKAGA